MGTRDIRLGCLLSFDEQQEADIIKALEVLNSSHKTGRFVSNLIRLAFDDPEIYESDRKDAVAKAMQDCELSYNRKIFMDGLEAKLNEMKKKVDKMYDMVLKTYILAQMGKYLGLEQKADNELMAQFVLEKQFKELQDILGMSMTSSVLASNKKQDVEKIANDALEYIIDSYSGIVNELKGIVNKQAEISQVTQMNDTQIENTVQNTNEIMENTENKEIARSIEESKEDEYIDFGSADYDALSNFFGDN